MTLGHGDQRRRIPVQLQAVIVASCSCIVTVRVLIMMWSLHMGHACAESCNRVTSRANTAQRDGVERVGPSTACIMRMMHFPPCAVMMVINANCSGHQESSRQIICWPVRCHGHDNRMACPGTLSCHSTSVICTQADCCNNPKLPA